MQPTHCTSDGPWVAQRLGDLRAQEGAYVWRRLIDSGATISSGTDAPVEDVCPIATFFAAVTRQLADGTRFYPGQCMTREEALRAGTINAAFAARQEAVKGSLEVGKYADITVLSKDILTVPEEEIPSTQVLLTIVGGEVSYSAL
jgi:predicted amidohydrolase YtcJ